MTVWCTVVHGVNRLVGGCSAARWCAGGGGPQVVEARTTATAASARRGRVEADDVEADRRTPRSVGRNTSGSPRPRISDVARRPRTDARDVEQLGRGTSSRSTPASSTRAPSATRRASSRDRAPRCCAASAAAPGRSRPARRRREHVGQRPAVDRRARSPTAATIRPATVRAPATEICWPIVALIDVSNGSTLPGTRSPGVLAIRRRERGVAAERVVDGGRIGVEVEQAADRGAPRPTGRASRRAAAGARRGARHPSRRRSPRPSRGHRAGRARGGRTCRPSARHRARRAAAKNANPSAMSNGSRTGSSSSTAPGRRRPAGPATRRSSLGVEANTSRTVSLNWRTLPKPAACGDVDEAQVRRLEQRAGGVGALGTGDGERPGTELVGEHAVEVALAVGRGVGRAR